MKKTIALVIAVAASTFCAPAAAQSVAGAFGKGRTHVQIFAGSGHAFDESYYLLGVGVSYHLVDGLAIGAAWETWTGGDPSIDKVTVGLQYVFYQAPVKPYLGGFYRRTSIERLPDLDSVGARAGIQFQAAPSAYFGVGLVYESYLDCSNSVYRSCDSFYPEASFTFAF
jgi:hypothetical protein